MNLLPHPALACLAITVAFALPAAQAATVYRCGPAGNAYSDLPCADGRALNADDARTEAQRLDGQRVAALEQRYAAQLQQERLRREAAPLPRAIGIGIGVQAPGASGARIVVPARPQAAKRRHHNTLPRTAAAGAEFTAIAPRTKARR